MSETTSISYAHHTASPWYGCTEVSPACANCYARSWGRKLKVEWGKGKPRMRSKSFEANVRKWNRAQEPFKSWANYERPRIFPSLCDWLDPEVPIEWLGDLLRVIYETPNLDHLLLTKRPQLFRERRARAMALIGRGKYNPGFEDWLKKWEEGQPPANIWFGVTCENQQTADERIPLLLQIPAKVRWVSAEPLLEPTNFCTCQAIGKSQPKQNHGITCPMWSGNASQGIDWIVVGGESGPNRRDCGSEAIVDVARQCQAAGVPVWCKQDCALKPGQQGRVLQDVWRLKQLPT